MLAVFLGKYEEGFTLLEAILIVLILAIIAAVIVPRLPYITPMVKERTCRHNLAIINDQIERYYLENSSWPAVNDLNTSDYFPDGWPDCPAGGAYTIDAARHRTVCPNGHTL